MFLVLIIPQSRKEGETPPTKKEEEEEGEISFPGVSVHDKNVIMAKMARSGDNLSLGDDIFPIRRGRGHIALVKRAPS